MSRTTGVDDCKLLELPRNHQVKGNITAINAMQELPFPINRVYYLYDVPGGETRGGHAHKDLHQFITAASGSFDLVIKDGKKEKRVHLNRPYYGLYMPPGLWRELENFSSGSICLVLASDNYDEGDYIRDYDNFNEYKI